MTEIQEFIAQQNRNPNGDYIDVGEDADVMRLIKAHDAAVLYVFTEWSAPAHQLFSVLTRAIRDSGVNPPVFVISYDVYASGLYKELGAPVFGGGETFWFKKGECVHKIWGYSRQLRPRLIEWTKDIVH